jgi:16S rRNA pseudouridine516 synthase
MEKMRIDRYFSSQEICSRREIKEALRKGLVTVNGAVIKQADFKVDPRADRIALSGREVGYQPYVYLMLNKPMGVVSATEDKKQKTVLDLVPPELYRSDLFPAGRLDKDTTGFVLLTNDGDFAHRILAPKNHISKTYYADVAQRVSQEDIAAFAAGIQLKTGELCLPASLRVLSEPTDPTESGCRCEIVICEGKYHQIKKMFEARQNRVLTLRRVKMGNLWLDEALPEGKCRRLTEEEVALIQSRE